MDRAKAIIIGVIPKDNSPFYQEDGILFAVVGELGRLFEEKQRQLINTLNLRTPEGIAAAQEQKGVLDGINLCINLIEGKEHGSSYDPNSSDDADGDSGPINTSEFIAG